MTIVVHLAAGQGTRLRPITNDRPKPLVELGGISLLERNVKTFQSVGIDEQIVVTGYMKEKIEELGYETVHNDEYDDTEMVYSLFCAEDRFPDDQDLIISYGDIIYDESVVEKLLDHDAPVSVVVDLEWGQLWEKRFEDPLSDAETLQMDKERRIREIGNDPDALVDIDGQYIGLIKIREDYIDPFVTEYERISENGALTVEMTSFIQHLIDLGWIVNSVPIEGRWVEVDTLDELRMYRRQLNSDPSLKHLNWI